MAFPPNYQGIYSDYAEYTIGDVVVSDGVYGIPGAYYIRIIDPNNQGYRPGGDRWAIYTMPKGIDGAGSVTGSGSIA